MNPLTSTFKTLCRGALLGAAVTLGLAGTAQAHFGMVIPSSDMVLEKGEANLNITFAFAHPMEMQGMPMEQPTVRIKDAGADKDLSKTLKATTFLGQKAWTAAYHVERPGVYQIIMEPRPYWEPAENCYIVHYTKVYVAAYGEETGWARPAGLKTEIVPLTRPFGNYAGNVFQGQVLLDGKPVAGCDVEVEYYNKDKAFKAPNPYMTTQVVKTDANGVFTYVAPFAGWWGFAALNTSPDKMVHQGSHKNVELGAVLWTRFVDPVKAQ